MKKLMLVFVIMGVMVTQSCFAPNDYAGIPAFISTVFTLSNTTLSSINIYQINQDKSFGKFTPITGIMVGELQVLWGLLDINNDGMNQFYLNGGLGTITMVSGIWNLVKVKKPLESRTSWNIYSFPTHDKSMGLGLSYSLRF